MRTLPRYVLVQLTKVFLFSLVVLTLLLVIGGVVREAISQNLPPAQIARLIPYFLPQMLPIAVPVTLLLATTSVYSRMSGCNEVVAIKSLGISPMVILWPALILAFLLSLLTVWLNDLAVTWGRSGARRVLIEAVEEIAYSMLKTHKQYNSPTFSINVKDVKDRRLILPTVLLKQGGTTGVITIRAEEAVLRADREAGVLKITSRNGTIDFGGKAIVDFPGEYPLEIPLREASRAAKSSRVPSSLPLRVIPEETARQTAEIKRYQQELAARATYQMLCGDFDGLTSPEWDTRCRVLDGMIDNLHRLQTEPYRRWSAGFSCLCFVLVGAPMAIRFRHSEFLASFALCFLPILAVYYPLFVYGIDGAKNGTIPPIFVWTGNVLLLLWGGVLLRRVIRY